MNSRTTTKRVLFAFVALMACDLTLACAPNQVSTQVSTNGATATAQTYTGRAIENKEAVELADSVIVGRVIDLGDRDVGAMGQTYYGQVKVEVAQTLKGPTSKTVTLSLTVQTLPVESFEETPKVDNSYILFLKKLNPKDTRGIKLLEATEENIATISTLVRSTADKN